MKKRLDDGQAGNPAQKVVNENVCTRFLISGNPETLINWVIALTRREVHQMPRLSHETPRCIFGAAKSQHCTRSKERPKVKGRRLHLHHILGKSRSPKLSNEHEAYQRCVVCKRRYLSQHVRGAIKL